MRWAYDMVCDYLHAHDIFTYDMPKSPTLSLPLRIFLLPAIKLDFSFSLRSEVEVFFSSSERVIFAFLIRWLTINGIFVRHFDARKIYFLPPTRWTSLKYAIYIDFRYHCLKTCFKILQHFMRRLRQSHAAKLYRENRVIISSFFCAFSIWLLLADVKVKLSQ